MPFFTIIFAVVLGLLFAQQPVLNASVARTLGSPVAAAAFSVSVTLVCLLLLMPFTGGTLRPSVLISLSWWSVAAGMIGVGIVAGGAFLVPIMGAAMFAVCLVAGQLFGAAIADHLGAFGLPVRSLSMTRLLGLGMVVSGAILVTRG